MRPLRLRFALPAIAIWLVVMATPASAQYFNIFGRNKVQYTHFDWQVMQTEHIDLYYYPEERALAEIAAASAERSYRLLEAQFTLTIHRRIPLILYSSHQFFEETNTIPFLLPESVGAFTEFLKGRVVIPHLGSYHDFDMVLRHELVHVFTLEKIKSVLMNHRRALRVSPPLWFTEGLAEHWSVGWDSESDMVIRDAVLSDYLVGIPDINRIYGSFLMYKEGQSFLKFIEERYGDDVIELIFENWWRGKTFDEIVRLSVGKTLKQLNEEWTYALKKRYYPLMKRADMPSMVAEKLTRKGINVKPVCVPDEQDSTRDAGMVFMTTRDGYEDICWAPLRGTEERVELLVRGGRSARFESFHLLRTRMAVNRAQQLAFVSQSGSQDVLYVWNLKTRELDHTLKFDSIVGISSPAWSPDNRRLAFSGLSTSGYSDLYIADIESGALVKLTNDLYEDRDPSWSPDGRRIAFSSDRANGGDTHGWHNLYTIDPETGYIEAWTQGAHNDHAPSWSPDGRWLAFTSDRDTGIDVYLMDKHRRTYRLTRLATAALDPVWTPDGRSLLITGFQGFEFQVHRLAVPDALTPVEPKPVARRLALWNPSRVEPQEIQDTAPYQREYSLDVAQGGLLVAPQATDVTFGGGVLFSLSDMLGDHYYNFLISNSTETTEDFLTSFNIVATRVNLKRRLNYGFGVFHLNGRFFDDRELLFEERRMGGLFVYTYPFSKFTRIEGNLGVMYSDRKDLFTSPLRQRRSALVSNYISYVHDATLWGLVGPVHGEGYQFGVTHLTDLRRGESYATTLLGDYRRYFRLSRRVTYAARGVGIGSFGDEPQIIRVGGSWDFRGYGFRSLRGTRMFMVNQELRFPVMDVLHLGFPFGGVSIPGIQGAVFLDAGNVWFDNRFGDVLGSFGGGFRIGLGGPLVFRFDFAKRVTDNFTSLEDGIVFQFFFGPNF